MQTHEEKDGEEDENTGAGAEQTTVEEADRKEKKAREKEGGRMLTPKKGSRFGEGNERRRRRTD